MKPEAVDEAFVSLLDEVNTALFFLDGEGRFIYASPAIERITGRTSGDLAGEPLSAILFVDSRDVFRELIGGEKGATVARDAWIAHADTGIVKCVIACSSHAASGMPRYTGIIWEKNRLDPETEEKMKMFAIAVEQSPATVVITDASGAIQYVNPKFTKLTGYTLNDVLGHNPRILKSGMQTKEFYQDLWQTISSGREWRGEFHNLKKDGDVYWESASISPVVNTKGEITHYVAVKEDVTARKKAEEELLVSEEKLRIKNEQMERDLKNAQVTVARLLPTAPPQSDRLQVDFRYLPVDAIGGDFFSFNTLHEPGLGVFIGDVAGHGVSAALFLALVRSETERCNAGRGTAPSEYLEELNVNLVESMSLSFFTALYGYFDFSSGHARFRFAKGGHTPPVHYRATEKKAAGLYAGGMPVGLSREARFEEFAAGLSRGDRIYLYTDGITEARNANRDMLETEGLIDFVQRGGSMALGESLDYILDETGRFRGNRPAEDDIVLIGFEIA